MSNPPPPPPRPPPTPPQQPQSDLIPIQERGVSDRHHFQSTHLRIHLHTLSCGSTSKYTQQPLGHHRVQYMEALQINASQPLEEWSSWKAAYSYSRLFGQNYQRNTVGAWVHGRLQTVNHHHYYLKKSTGSLARVVMVAVIVVFGLCCSSIEVFTKWNLILG